LSGGSGGDSSVSSTSDLPVGDTLLSSGFLGSSGESLGGSSLLLFTLNLLRVAVLSREGHQTVVGLRGDSRKTYEEHVDHNGPSVGSARDGSTETEDLSAKEPPDETDRVLRLVVGGDSDIDVVQGGVGVADGDNGDVNVGSLTNGLVIDSGVGDDDQTGLLERLGDVIGEVTGSESSSDGLGTSVGSELEDGTVTVRTSRDDANIVGVLDGSDDTGGEDELLPGLSNVDNVDT